MWFMYFWLRGRWTCSGVRFTCSSSFWLGAQCTFLSAWLGNLFSTGSTKGTSLNDRGVIGFLWCFGIVWFLWCFGIVLVSLAESPVDLWQYCQHPQPRNQVSICLINSDCHNAPRSAHCSAPKRRDDSLDPPALTLGSLPTNGHEIFHSKRTIPIRNQ